MDLTHKKNLWYAMALEHQLMGKITPKNSVKMAMVNSDAELVAHLRDVYRANTENEDYIKIILNYAQAIGVMN